MNKTLKIFVTNFFLIFLFISVLLLSSCAKSVIIAENNAKKGPLWLTLPGKTWAFGVKYSEFNISWDRIVERGKNGGLSREVMAINEKNGLGMSIMIEQEGHYPNPMAIRDIDWSPERIKKLGGSDFKKSERDNMAIVEYMVRTVPKGNEAMKDMIGIQLNQKNIHAYWVKGDSWIEMHLSKAKFQPEDLALFKAVIDSAKIMPGSDPKVLGNFITASNLYKQGKLAASIIPYENVMVIEKQRSTLDHDLWRVLVDNLGMAYGVNGDLEKSRSTFEYGISKDPEYPMFHYNLACGYAEGNDLDKAIIELRLSYKYKGNNIRGEKLPDPRTDDSFKRYMTNEKFLKALVEME